MKLKYFFTLIVAFLGVVFVACNSDNEVTYLASSSDGQIISFSVDADPYTANDSIAYPALKTTKFSVQNNEGTHFIFNVDSLPVNTEIRSLAITLGYPTDIEPSRVNLIYPKDSTVLWNGTDSVRFMKQNGEYYPRIKTTSPNGTLDRTYKIDFRIHKLDPDSIKWINMGKDKGFDLPLVGESKVLLDKSKGEFKAFIRKGNVFYFYTTPTGNMSWSAAKTVTGLSSKVLVKSICMTANYMAALDSDGNVYTSAINDGVAWSKESALTNIVSFVGVLPEIDTQSPKAELLVLYRDAVDSKIKYGKIGASKAIEELKVSSRGENNEVLNGFPIKNFTSVLHTVEGDDEALMVTGGVNEQNDLLKKTWRIVNRSLGSQTSKGEISVVSGSNIRVFPEKDQVVTFSYDEKMYAMSTDSLSLYYSIDGDNWNLSNEKMKLKEEMVDLGNPSVIVDQTDYIWIFGGVSKEGVYSQQIWRGRLNRLGYKR